MTNIEMFYEIFWRIYTDHEKKYTRLFFTKLLTYFQAADIQKGFFLNNDY